jgi:hypothetical protein
MQEYATSNTSKLMAKLSQLVSYFENLARSHKDIGHSDLEKHFFRMEVDEVLAGINRTDVQYPFLILEGYSYDFTDNKSDNLLKNRRGAFILMDHVSDPSDYQSIQQVWENMEEIGDQLLIRIKADKRNPRIAAVRDFDFSSVEALLIANEIDGNYGIRFTYTLTSPHPNEIDPTKWLSEG